MYRAMLKEDINIYCDVWPCDRECGKFHKRFTNTTKLRCQDKAESLRRETSVNENDQNNKSNGIFEAIMEKAMRKDSQQFVQPPMPSLPEKYANITLGSTKTQVRPVSSSVDTTTIYFDNPVWDDAKYRQELLDWDDETFSISKAPYIVEDEDTVDGILRDTEHEFTSNPIRHFERDETILGEHDDEHDYSNLDLSKPIATTSEDGHRSTTPTGVANKLRSPDAKYEKSLNDL